MPDFLTRTEVAAIGKRAIKSIPESKIDPAAIDKRGSTMNILVVGAGGALCEEVQRRAYAKLAALTRSGARGDELDAVIYEDTFGQVQRLGASKSITTVEVSRAAGPLPQGTVDAGTIGLAGSIEYELDLPVSFAAGEKGPKRVTVTSTAVGPGTRSPKGAINAWANAGALFDANLQIVSVEDTAGGDLREEDDTFIARAEHWAETLGRGTLPAIELAAVQIGGVRYAVAVESTNSVGEISGPVALHIADSWGQANEALCLRVARGLRDARCGGIPVLVVGSLPYYQGIKLAPGIRDGFSRPIVEAQCRALVVASVNRLMPNAKLERSLLFAAMRATPGMIVGGDAVVSPASDVAPPFGQSVKTRDDLVEFA